MSFFLKLCASPSILFIVSCFMIYYVVYVRQIHRWKASNIPFTKPFFLFGHKHFFKLFTSSIVVPLDMIYRDNTDKDLVGFFLGVSPVILLKEPNLIKQVYAKCFDKMFEIGFSPPKDDVAYQSVIPLNSDRALWKTGRSALAPSFRTSKLETTEYSKFKTQIYRLWSYAEKSEQLGQPFNSKEAVHNFVVDSVNILHYNVDTNSWGNKTALYDVIGSLFAVTYQRLLSFITLILFPYTQNFNFFRFIRLDHVDTATEFLTKTIDYRDQHQISHNDFIDHLRSLRGENNEGIGVKEMSGYILSWSLAGADTTSQQGHYAIHLLSLHPEYQDKIREEVDEVMKRLNVSEITFQVVNELQLIKYCLLETSRFYPILPAIMRRCSDDFQIPGTKYELRKGDLIFITPYSIHRDPRYFKDPEKFYPERFSPENRDAANLDMYVAFGAGPRKCPGNQIGMSLNVMIIASLLYKYELRPLSHMKPMTATNYDPRGFTSTHEKEVLVELVPRRKSSP